MTALLLSLFFIFSAHAGAPSWWAAGHSVVEKHEFYKDNEVIVKPKDSWQLLFAVTYTNSSFKKMKDCLFYRVPGELEGTLKIKSLPLETSCELEILSPGDQEIKDVRNLQYAVLKNGLKLTFKLPMYKSEIWEVEFANTFEKKAPEMHTSSAEYKASKLIFLAPSRVDVSVPAISAIEENSICHDIADDCSELKPSTCNQCLNGWHERPNGCAEGPKYCGNIRCGEKNQPACRKGIVHQRVRKKYECRLDSSFAYCSPGLTIQCEGSLAYCR